jgi:hypothetical protein
MENTFHMKEKEARVAVIGVEKEELRWLKTLVTLLRHPDPSVPELARQALLYLTGAAEQRNSVPNDRKEAYQTI